MSAEPESDVGSGTERPGDLADLGDPVDVLRTLTLTLTFTLSTDVASVAWPADQPIGAPR